MWRSSSTIKNVHVQKRYSLITTKGLEASRGESQFLCSGAQLLASSRGGARGRMLPKFENLKPGSTRHGSIIFTGVLHHTFYLPSLKPFVCTIWRWAGDRFQYNRTGFLKLMIWGHHLEELLASSFYRPPSNGISINTCASFRFGLPAEGISVHRWLIWGPLGTFG